MTIKSSSKRFWPLILMLAAFAWTFGCEESTSTQDPLAGWKLDFNEKPNQAIEKDYQDYIQKLPAKDKDFVSGVNFLEDGTGQHAIHLTIGVGGTWWEHVLIYDKDNKRIKTVKYKNGGYRS